MRWQRGRVNHPRVEISEKRGIRYLHLGGPAVQSAMRLRDPLALELEYTRAMMAFLLFHPAPRQIGLIGLGGGSIAKFIHHYLPETHLTAVEINPEVVAAARSYFHLPADDEHLDVLTADGAAYVHAQRARLDVLLVDGYDALRIVEDLASPAFYQSCRDALRAGGVALFNLWGSDLSFSTYFERIQAAFAGQTLRLPSERKGNIIILAFRDPLDAAEFTQLDSHAQRWSEALGLEFPEFMARLRHWNPYIVKCFGS